MPVKPIPDDYPNLSPMLVVKDAASAIEFYRSAFGAQERMRLTSASGAVVHAELAIDGAIFMLGEGDAINKSPDALGGSPVRIHLYVDNVDVVAAQAVASGAKIVIPISDQFYGDRSGRLKDPFGHLWILSTRIEEVSPQEMQHRMAALAAG